MTSADPTRRVRALADEIRGRGKPAAGAAFVPPPPRPPDLELLAAALAETSGYFTFGWWELGFGGEELARKLVARFEDPTLVELPETGHLYLLANNAGGLVLVVAYDDDSDHADVYLAEEEFGEIRRIDRLDGWVDEVLADSRQDAHDRSGLRAAVRARLAS